MYVERRVCIGQESALPMQNADLTARSSCNASLGGKFSAEAKQTQDCGRRQVNVKRGMCAEFGCCLAGLVSLSEVLRLDSDSDTAVTGVRDGDVQPAEIWQARPRP